MNPIEIIFKGKDETKAAIASVKSGLDGIQESAKKTGGAFDTAMGVLAANQIQQFANAVSGFMTDSIREASEMQDAMSQIEQVLQSTGKASTITAEEVAKMAEGFSRVSNFEDDMVASGQLVLLQFTNLGEDVLPRATQAMIDMATRMKMDLPSAAKIVGKALEGEIGSLARLGIVIDDATKKQIEGLMKVGDVAGAQAIILEQFEAKFGGAAEASTKTWTGAMANLEKSVANLKGAFGEVILNSPSVVKAINSIAEAINWLAESFEKLPEGAKLGIAGFVGAVALLGQAAPALISAKVLLDGFGKGAGGAAGKVGFLTRVLTALKGLAIPAAIFTWVSALDKAGQGLSEWGIKARKELGIEIPAELQKLTEIAATEGVFSFALIGAEIDLVKTAVVTLWQDASAGLASFKASSDVTWADTRAALENMGPAFDQFMQQASFVLFDWLNRASIASSQIVQIIGIGFSQAGAAIKLHVTTWAQDTAIGFMLMVNTAIQSSSQIVKIVQIGWQQMTRAIQEGFNRALSSVRNFWSNLRTSFSRLISEARNWGTSIVQGIWTGIQSGWTWLLNMVRTNINSLLQWVKDLIGYGSPAKKLIPLGLSMAQGVGVGWERGMEQLKPSMSLALSPSYARAGAVSGGMGGATISGNTFAFYSPLTHDERRRIRKEQEDAAQRELLRSLR